MQLFINSKTASSVTSSVPDFGAIPSVDATANSIVEFIFDPDANITFDMWFRRYEDHFKFDFTA